METEPDCLPDDGDKQSWAARWAIQKKRHLESVNTPHEGEFWMDPDNVRRYLENTRGSYGRVIADQLKTMIIPSRARILDIGAGAGSLAVPLAKKGCDVTAVELSPLMCAALEKYRESEGAPPITVITRRWEDISPSDLHTPYDVTIASYSLTMVEIADAIRKIQAVTSGRVYLFWFLTPPSWAGVMRDLWPSLHHRQYYSSPLADCLWNVLYEMGIYAHIEVQSPAPPRIFETVDQAVRHMAGRLNCTEEWQIQIITNYYRERMEHCPDGRYLCEEGHRSAKIWWDISNKNRQMP